MMYHYGLSLDEIGRMTIRQVMMLYEDLADILKTERKNA